MRFKKNSSRSNKTGPTFSENWGKSQCGLVSFGGKRSASKIKTAGDPSIFDPNSDDVIIPLP